jgi:hypothetical protein
VKGVPIVVRKSVPDMASNEVPGPRDMGASAYSQRVLATQPLHLIGYWPLGERNGPLAQDLSPKGNNGVYAGAGITYGDPGIGDGQTCVRFSGADTHVRIASEGFARDWNGDVGSMMAWGKVKERGVWTDGAVRWLVHISSQYDEKYWMVMGKVHKPYWDGDNTLTWRRKAGGIIVQVHHVFTGACPLDWFCMSMTWDRRVPELRAYLNGILMDVSGPGMAPWGDNPPRYGPPPELTSEGDTCLFAGNTSTQEWFGWGAHVAIWAGAVLSDADMARLARV